MRERGLRVLVFGLDQRLAGFAIDILTEDGYQATIADSRPAVLSLAKSVNPDVILVELALSVCSCGWNLVAELQSNPETSRIPILAIADSEKYLEDESFRFNVGHGIIKPYDIDDLEQGIAAAAVGVPTLPRLTKPRTTSGLLDQAADVVARESYSITVQWSRRILRVGGVELPNALSVRLLLNTVAAWQIAVVSALRYGLQEVSRSEEIREKILDSFLEARRQGVTLAQITSLFDVFRDEVWLTLDRAGFESSTADAVSELYRAVSMSLESVMDQIAEVDEATSALNIH